MTRKITTRAIRRMRSPPRIVSIAGDIGESSPMESVAVRQMVPDKPEVPDAKPTIINSVFMRPEARTDVPSSLFTSVLTLPENETSPRVVPPKLSHDTFIEQAKLLAHSTSRTTATLDINPRWIRDSHALNAMTKEMCGGRGLVIRPGQTIVCRLNHHRDSTGGSRCFLEGDQAVRLSLLNEGGGLISDLDIPPHSMPFSIEIERAVSFLSLTGLGGHPDVLKAIEPGAGAVTLTCSTDNTVATGFHPRNRVVLTTGGFQLCRGGVIHANGAPDRETGWATADDVLKSADRVSLQTSSCIDMVLIIYRNTETPQITAEGIDVTGEPHTIRSENLNASLWRVRSNNHNGSLCTITAQVKVAGSIHSIIGAKGSLQSWIRTLENCDWSTIVEEGAISNHGKATIRLEVPQMAPNEHPSAPVASQTIRSTKKSTSKKTAKRGIYDLGELELGTEFKRDVSSLAADDDLGDTITFSSVSGAEFLSVSPEGTIIGVPTETQPLGSFEFVVRVTDSEGAHADATFYGTVINPQDNTSPYWKEDAQVEGEDER